ncbi:MAG: tetratricopeptide repeat protein [Acidobacteriota bacterium]
MPWRAAATVVAAALVAWVAGGVVTRRVQAARIPPPPELSATAAPIREALLAADSAARSAPSAASIGGLARAYHANLRATEALQLYAVAERLAPADWIWTYDRALLLEERGDQAATRAALERVVAQAPQVGLAWYRLAELAFKQRRLDDASAAYQHARDAPGQPPFTPPGVTSRQLVPLGAYAGLGLGRVALERGDAAGAVQQLTRVVESYPAFGPARSLLRTIERGVTPAASGQRGFAAPFVPPADPVLDAIVAESRHSDMLLKHAGLATRAGDDAFREYLVRRALRYNPTDLNVLMEMAAMLQATGRLTEALEVLKQHEALAPGEHHTLVEEGRTLTDLGRFAEAEAVLRRAVVVRDAAAEYNLGTVLDHEQRWDEARQHYERALVIDPFHTRAMNNLGVGLDRRGEGRAALAMFERALAIEPNTAEYYVNYGSALIQQGRFDAAVTALQEAVGLEPRSSNAHNNLGIALARLGQLPRARDEFVAAVRLDPTHENARRNLEHLSGMVPPRPR